MDGAGDGIRTRDIDLGKVALYQLSYSRTGGTDTYFRVVRGLLSNRIPFRYKMSLKEGLFQAQDGRADFLEME